jgi:hypothetical protein
MFNKSTNSLKKYSLIIMILMAFTSCKKDIQLAFDDAKIEQSTNAEIEINYPKAEGTPEVADAINKHIETFIVSELNMTETDNSQLTLPKVVQQFDDEYKAFVSEFGESSQAWTANVDGDVAYQSDQVICVTLESYLDTGGAHGNGNTAFLNFNPKTGALLKLDDMVKDVAGFKILAESYFKNETDTKEQVEDYFFGEGFQLPANLGFDKNGIILLYNNYEIASYAQGITKFTIPYEEAKAFLKVH